jgi:hypothetical protein
MGGTALSVAGFVALALFEQYNGMLAELRNDLKRFHEASGELVRKRSLQRLREALKEQVKQGHAFDLARAQMERELRACEKARQDTAAELQRLRERVARLEGRQMAGTETCPGGSPAARGERPPP